jgi:hypothetical protein
MSKFLVGILPSDSLDAETQTALAARGFREGARLEYETGWTEADEPATRLVGRIIFHYEAADAEQAEADARAVVGPEFNVLVTRAGL